MSVTRRQVLGGVTALAAGAAGLVALGGRKTPRFRYGPLAPDPAGIIDLPPGFSYRVLAKTGDRMSDGQSRRGAPDGMAAFAGVPGETVLLLNHELVDGGGGVSRLVVDSETLEVKSSNDVLLGTSRNCAGGPSPWGWLSCEETEFGGVWLCPSDAERTLSSERRRRVDDYGSFQHEAVCIDPASFTAYLTEDDGPSHLYRMVPDDGERDPHRGQLYALKHAHAERFDTAELPLGARFDVTWIEVEPLQARRSAKQKGAAIFHRGEGIWFFDGQVYFTATKYDQLFRLSPTKNGGRVELVANDLDSPDNITVAPWGDVFVAEDQSGTCRLRVVRPNGEVSDFAENRTGLGREFAGVCFSPDGRTLFVNLQWTGHTLAIVGPFDRA